IRCSLTIASSLTSPVIAVNAAAAVPGPFSRNLRRDSVPASVTARFIEERQIDGQTTSICNLNAYDYFCLIDQESANECIHTVIPQDVIHCISLLCPNSSVKVINCVITPLQMALPTIRDWKKSKIHFRISDIALKWHRPEAE
ncbi:hypothetical protein BGY98DRAFT_943467, partial [Russula aff. rugulosa BPL654]